MAVKDITTIETVNGREVRITFDLEGPRIDGARLVWDVVNVRVEAAS